jgi:tRNA threonylcarbamoyladenosine biosynthesis protein TsaB
VLILGIDTSGRQGSVALLRADEDEQLVTLELVPISGGQYSELLVPSIAGLLARHGFERRSIDLIGVASGPGSFTGLRIAIATTKGLAEAFATPVVAVSVLEAIALASATGSAALPLASATGSAALPLASATGSAALPLASATGSAALPDAPASATGALSARPVLAALDAQRSELFFGEYMVNASSQEPAHMMREGIASFGDFTSIIAACDPPAPIFTPDDGLATRLHEVALDAHLLTRPTAEFYARIAHRKFLAGVRADVATLDANYLRRSDAEIFSPPKPSSASR